MSELSELRKEIALLRAEQELFAETIICAIIAAQVGTQISSEQIVELAKRQVQIAKSLASGDVTES